MELGLFTVSPVLFFILYCGVIYRFLFLAEDFRIIIIKIAVFTFLPDFLLLLFYLITCYAQL
ncbi:hypothetical protein CW304_25450 [Bacillus sp. UFRGS-B20]|nr:hypothetical protein CW304_25450 [Bacillus sp. UFRGS-B20]